MLRVRYVSAVSSRAVGWGFSGGFRSDVFFHQTLASMSSSVTKFIPRACSTSRSVLVSMILNYEVCGVWQGSAGTPQIGFVRALCHDFYIFFCSFVFPDSCAIDVHLQASSCF